MNYQSPEEAQKNHPRIFEDLTYVYPVISRRSGGVSIGVNLNLDKNCNFDCPYCQVFRTEKLNPSAINLEKIHHELQILLSTFDSEGVCQLPIFSNLQNHQKILRDIALSGDGEPTLVKEFPEVCEMLYKIQQNTIQPLSLVLISNATLFHKPAVQKGIHTLLAKQGDVWAKLDAGTSEWYHKINKTQVPFSQILSNLKLLAQKYPITIQSLWHQLGEEVPTGEEFLAFLSQINHILSQGGKIKEIHLHTVTRAPSDSKARPLEKSLLEKWKELCIEQTGVNTKIF